MSFNEPTKSPQGIRDDLNAAAEAIHDLDRKFSGIALAHGEGYIASERFAAAVRQYKAEAAEVHDRFLSAGEAFAGEVPCPGPDDLPPAAEWVLAVRAIAARLDALATGQLVTTRMLAALAASVDRLTAAQLGGSEAVLKLADAVSEPDVDPDDPYGVAHLRYDEDDE